jgi:putative transposase
MSASNSIIYIHITWATKHRIDFLREENILNAVINHIRHKAYGKGIKIDAIGGAVDHLHVLILLPSTMTLARTIKLIKGGSSHWIRRNIKGLESFSWQKGYYARVVPIKGTNAVRQYINNQLEHHSDKLNSG